MKADQANTRTVDVHDRDGNVVGSKEVVLYAGLLNQAHEDGLKSVTTELLLTPTEANSHLCIVKATVETSKGQFEALGDADPTSVEAKLVPHLIRVAETRAKARALRDAVNIGVVSYEELDGAELAPRASDPGPGAAPPSRSPRHAENGSRPPRPRPTAPSRSPRVSNGTELMSEAQRRYLFRIMAGKGLHKEGAEEHLKDLFRVDALASVTRLAATKMIDELLASAPGNGAGGHGASTRHQR